MSSAVSSETPDNNNGATRDGGRLLAYVGNARQPIKAALMCTCSLDAKRDDQICRLRRAQDTPRSSITFWQTHAEERGSAPLRPQDFAVAA